jgi:hypothetical protein
MIISASYKTDLLAYFPRWLKNRFEAGYVVTENPYNRKPSRISLEPQDVDGVIFWTRNPRPFMKIGGFDWLEERGIPFYLQMTHIGYHIDLEPRGLDSVDAMVAMGEVVERFGPGRINWRYDPIVFTDNYGYYWHKGHFDWLCRTFTRYVDEVTISYVELYRKAEQKMEWAGINYAGLQPNEEQMKSMTAELEHVAAQYGITLNVCSQKKAIGGAAKAAACVDANKLSAIAGRRIVAEKKGNRPDCGCAKSRDIGAYDTCLNQCAYCYACASIKLPQTNRRRHDPAGESLLPLSQPAPAKKREAELQISLPLVESVI